MKSAPPYSNEVSMFGLVVGEVVLAEPHERGVVVADSLLRPQLGKHIVSLFDKSRVVLLKALVHHLAASLAADGVAGGGGADNAVADKRACGVNVDVAGVVDAVGDDLEVGGNVHLPVNENVSLRSELIVVDELEAVVVELRGEQRLADVGTVVGKLLAVYEVVVNDDELAAVDKRVADTADELLSLEVGKGGVYVVVQRADEHSVDPYVLVKSDALELTDDDVYVLDTVVCDVLSEEVEVHGVGLDEKRLYQAVGLQLERCGRSEIPAQAGGRQVGDAARVDVGPDRNDSLRAKRHHGDGFVIVAAPYVKIVSAGGKRRRYASDVGVGVLDTVDHRVLGKLL